MTDTTLRYMGRYSSLATVLAVGLTGTVVAQPPAANPPNVPSSAPAIVKPSPVADLRTALDHVAWNARERGPIIAVTPEQVPSRPLLGSTPRDPQPVGAVPPPAEERHLNIEAAAQQFRRRVVRMGSLVVLAPTTMTVLNTRLGPPDPLQGMNQNEKLRLFEASLGADQWRKLGSADGLGMEDLTADQKKLFLALVPDPFRVTVGTTKGGYYSFIPNPPGPTANPVISEAQRRATRLRLNRSVRYILAGPDNETRPDSQIYPSKPAGATVNRLDRPYQATKEEAFGTPLVSVVPSRLKPSELDGDAPVFAVDVSLVGIKTVGEAVKLVREKTGVEIYCDGRPAALPLYVSDVTVPVRAGDLLKALCWCMTGTFRKVGPDSAGKTAFVLTDDIEGIGTRRARIDRWQATGDALAKQLQARLDARIRAQAPLKYLDFAPGDALALTPDAMKQVEAQWGTVQYRYGAPLPITALNADQRALVEAEAKKFYDRSEADPSHPTVLADRVLVHLETQLTFVVPGVGDVEVNSGGFDTLSPLLPPPTKIGAAHGEICSYGGAIRLACVGPVGRRGHGAAAFA